MTTTASSVQDWRVGFASVEAETPDEVDLPMVGSLPPELDGTLYRIGPARFEVGGERYRHWFDGDGMVHAIRLGGGRAGYRSRFVDTAGKRVEDAAGRRLLAGGFYTPPPGNALHRARHYRPKNVANVNVVSHAGALRALWEGGRPHRLDADTLATVGEDDLGGLLGRNDGFSAHPKLDPETGELWNFGITYGPRPRLSIYRGDATGHWKRVVRHALPHAFMVHDMALTPRSVILVLAPLALPLIPFAMVTGRRGFAQALRWRPRWGTSILVVDRNSGATRSFAGEPLMVFHVAGAREDGGEIEVDLCTYPDARVIGAFGAVLDGQPPIDVTPTLERLCASDRGIVTRRPLADVPFEFPRQTRDGRLVGLTVGEGATFLNTPVIVDPAGSTTSATMAPWEFAGECVPVHGRWGLTIVLNGRTTTSELRVLDLHDLSAPPVAVARLPHTVPFGLHGNFVSRN